MKNQENHQTTNAELGNFNQITATQNTEGDQEEGCCSKCQKIVLLIKIMIEIIINVATIIYGFNNYNGTNMKISGLILLIVGVIVLLVLWILVILLIKNKQILSKKKKIAIICLSAFAVILLVVGGILNVELKVNLGFQAPSFDFANKIVGGFGIATGISQVMTMFLVCRLKSTD